MAVCESTGGYERLLVSRLRKTEIRMDAAHPSRVRAFARACGYEAKTDTQDAPVLSRFGQVFPERTPPGWELEPELEELQDLLRRRRQLVEQRVQELGRLDKGAAPAVAKSTKRHIVWLEKEIARLNQEYQAAPQSSAPMARRAALYRTVPGVGALTAATLVAHLPELGQQSFDLSDGRGALVSGQRAKAGPAGHSRWPQSGAPRLVHLRVVRDPGRRPNTSLLSKPAPAWEAGQSSPGGGDAQAAVAAERGSSSGNALGGPDRLKRSVSYPCKLLQI